MKYIIEIEDEPFGRNDDPVIPHGMDELYRAKGFNSLVFDKNGLDKLTPLDKELEEAYQRGLEEGKARNENGCVGCRYDDGIIEHSPCDYCCNAYSNQWSAKEESDEIKVGDEVTPKSNDSNWMGVVVGFDDTDAIVMSRSGYTAIYQPETLKKTNKNFPQVAKLLKAMKGEQRNCSECEHDGDSRFCDPCRHNDMWQPKGNAE